MGLLQGWHERLLSKVSGRLTYMGLPELSQTICTSV